MPTLSDGTPIQMQDKTYEPVLQSFVYTSDFNGVVQYIAGLFEYGYIFVDLGIIPQPLQACHGLLLLSNRGNDIRVDHCSNST